MEKTNSKTTLSIEAKTWKKETDDWFDFEAEDIKSTSFNFTNLKHQIFWFASQDSLQTTPSLSQILSNPMNNNLENQLKILSEITFSKSTSSYIIQNPMKSRYLHNQHVHKNFLSRTWTISKKNIAQEIQLGDIIKLGRVRLKLSTINIKSYKSVSNTNVHNTINNTIHQDIDNFLWEPSAATNNNNIKVNCAYGAGNTVTNINNSWNNDDRDDNSQCSSSKIGESSNRKIYCRICYSASNTKSDPLISPCKCSGSMQFIHFLCLKQCMKTKLHVKVDSSFIFYSWKSFECEICWERYPKYLRFNNALYSIIDISPNFEEYIICDYSWFDDTRKQSFYRGWWIISVEDNRDITIGRTQNNNVKWKDISVSREHCSLIKKNDKLYITDKGSKFGTLRYLMNEVSINLSTMSRINLISGKFSFEVSLNQSSNFLEKWFSFGCCESKNINDKEFIDDSFENKSEDKLILCANNNNNKAKSEKPNEEKILDDSYEDYILEVKNEDCNERGNVK